MGGVQDNVKVKGLERKEIEGVGAKEGNGMCALTSSSINKKERKHNLDRTRNMEADEIIVNATHLIGEDK